MHASIAQRAFPFIAAAVVVVSLAVPARFQRWLEWPHEKILIAAAPLSRPLIVLGSWLRGGRTRVEDEGLRILEEQLELTKAELLRQRQENARLIQTIADLNSAFRPRNEPIRQVVAGVIAYSTDPRSPFLTAQAGTLQGVALPAFALAPGLQLVGQVVAIEERVCTIRPITSRAAGPLRCVVIIKPGDPSGLVCTLRPAGDGTLRGPVEDRRDLATNTPIEPAVGQDVRLDDPAWPMSSRMLLIGRVERIDPNPDQPLRRILTIRPTVEGLDRLSEVIIWSPDLTSNSDKP